MAASRYIQSSRQGRMSRRMSLAPSLIMATQEEQAERTHTVKDFICSHIKTLVTVFMIFGTIAVIVVIVMVHKWRWESQLQEAERACLDVAIVGGGISGFFSAWRLRDRGQKVQVFELSNRIGGRFYTRHLADSAEGYAELGAMYYIPQYHRRLNSVIHALKLKPTLFRPQNQDHYMYYLRGVHLRAEDLTNSSRLPYRLNEDEQNKTLDELKSMYIRKVLSSGSDPKMNPLTATTKDGDHLYKHGYWTLLNRVASNEGYKLLYDTAPWRSLFSNENAALLGNANVDPEGTKMTVEGGMDTVVKGLREQFLNASKKHKVSTNHRLACIHKRERFGYKLKFIKTLTKRGITKDGEETRDVCTRKVVLALPKIALERVDWSPFFEDKIVRDNLNAVTQVPAIRVFFAYNTTWWTDGEPRDHRVITDLPIRQTMYSGRRGYRTVDDGDFNDVDKKHLLLVASLDGKNDAKYFEGLINEYKEGKNCSKSSSIVQDITKQLSMIYKIPEEDIPAPCKVLILDWERTPSGGGWYIWKAGVQWDRVMRGMVRPKSLEHVYVVGSTYCGGPCQFWAEGGLRTVDQMFDLHFDGQW